MGKYNRKTKIKEHKTKEYTLSLTSRETWDPSAAMYQDQNDFSLYSVKKGICLDMRFDNYRADLVLLNVGGNDTSYDLSGSKKELLQKSKENVEKKLSVYPHLDHVLFGIFDGMIKGDFLKELWASYDSLDEIPDYYFGSDSTIVMSKQGVSDTPQIERLLASLKKGKTNLEQRFARAISGVETWDTPKVYDSWRGFEETLLGVHQQTSVLVGKAQQIHDLIQNKHPKMSEASTGRLCGRVRKKIRQHLASTLDDLSLTEDELGIWKKRLGINN